MVVVKIKIEFLIKLILILMFLVFFILNLIDRDLSNSFTTAQKNGSYNVVVTGGSNAMYGLSAEKIKSNSGESINLSLPAEGMIFNNYVTWLTKLNVKTHAVIYSPISFWDVKELDEQDLSLIQKIQNLFPKISLLRYLTNLFSHTSFNPPRNSHGDLVEFKCNTNFFEWKASNDYIKRALAATNHFKRRMSEIRKATNAEIVILRIPPLFVSNSDKNLIEPKIQEVITSYQRQGILVLQEPVVLSSEKSFFCDHAYHPSEAGRYFFTENYIDGLKKMP
jgi:hypothetical protein